MFFAFGHGNKGDPKTQVVAAIGKAEFLRECLSSYSSYQASELIPIHWRMLDSGPTHMYTV
jgi:hypothetical protein